MPAEDGKKPKAQHAQEIKIADSLQESTRSDRTIVSNEFRDCRDAASTFHNCDLSNLENLIAAKYESFLRSQTRWPRIFNEARSRHRDTLDLIGDLRSRLSKSKNQVDEVLRAYIKHQYEIDAAIIAHLEIRKRYNERPFRYELLDLVDAYHHRLHRLYVHDVPFGRSDISRFFNENYIYILLNAPEEDAVDLLESYLTEALWMQLNFIYGCFGHELTTARKETGRKMKILNKARQIRDPVKLLPYRRPIRSRDVGAFWPNHP
jgi:hypothetical protein